MAGEHRDGRGEAPPAGEQLHLPGPSFLPVVVAFGVSLAVVGVVIYPLLALIGLIVAMIAVVGWVREARTEMADLPVEHLHS